MSVTIQSSEQTSSVKVFPYNQDVINIIKEYKNRSYNGETKVFTMRNEDVETMKTKLDAKGLSWIESKEEETPKVYDADDETIKLKYNDKMLTVLNNKINNKNLYYDLKNILTKQENKFCFNENLLLYFMELCKKHGTNKFLIF
jgi:hypothetical protein